jgi:hypothetical protein
MRNRNLLQKLYVIFFLVIFAGYYACITFFYHTHVVLGETIGYSHPYKTEADGKPVHSHSEKGYITIYLLSCLTFSIGVFSLGLKNITAVLFEILPAIKKGIASDTHYCLPLLRAPPRYFCIKSQS